jgi:bifunctional DNase/RNase
MIEVKVNGIFVTQTQASGILLKELEGERTLPIIIGEYEAQSIALGLESIKPPRPITHDLIINLLDTSGVALENVLITELKDNTFFAVLRCKMNMELLEIDSRPSDAIALAVRLGTPIFIDELVMEQAAYIPDEKEKEESQNYIFNTLDNEIDKLKDELQKAVESEDYEKAAKIRDKIKQLESKS